MLIKFISVNFDEGLKLKRMKILEVISKNSIATLLQNYINTVKRFPLSTLMGMTSTVLFLYLTWKTDFNNTPEAIISNYAIFSILGLSFMLAIELINESNNIPKWLVYSVAILFVAFLCYKINKMNTIVFDNKTLNIEYFVLFAVFHLGVSVLPYLFNSNVISFWQYNKTLFLGILTAFLYSFTLSLGLNLAILGIQNLFDIDFSHRPYLYTFIVINILFNNAFFLSSLPKLKDIENDDSYPIGLKVFTQYVLLPLVALYIVILLAYELKIGISLSLPKGWVSIMVLASAVFGILAFLLVYPIKSQNRWVQIFNKIYYWLLLPLIVLMLIAIYFRINQYGLTEFRYFVALLSIWLLGISLYFSISKVDNIKVIPLSLLSVLMLGIYAPFNAFQSSKINQVKRLNEVFKQEKILKNGKISIPKNKTFDQKNQDKFGAALEFLIENHPLELKPFLTNDQYQKISKEDSYNKYYFLTDQIGFKTITNAYKFETKFIEYKIEQSVPMKGFDTFKDFRYLNNESQKFEVGNDKFDIKINDHIIKLIVNNRDTVYFDLNSVKDFTKDQVDIEKLIFKKETPTWRFMFVLKGGSSGTKELEVNNASLFLAKK